MKRPAARMTPLNTITDAELRELFLLVNHSYNQKGHARRDRTLIKAEQKLSDERALRRRVAILKAGRRSKDGEPIFEGRRLGSTEQMTFVEGYNRRGALA
jgi:hypothetical protein